jgi:hypothetical protein
LPQTVAGVAYVDVDVFGGIPEKLTDEDNSIRRLRTPREIADAASVFLEPAPDTNQPPQRMPVNLAGFDKGTMNPAQLGYLTPDVADTLVLNQVV